MNKEEIIKALEAECPEVLKQWGDEDCEANVACKPCTGYEGYRAGYEAAIALIKSL